MTDVVVTAPDLALEARLDNWGVVQRMRGTGAARSVEGRYRSRPGQEREYETGQWTPGVRHAELSRPVATDPRDADAVERAVSALDLFHHTLLKAWYVRRLAERPSLVVSWKAAGEPVKRRYKGFYECMRMAQALLVVELDRSAVTRKDHAVARVEAALGRMGP